MRAALTLCLALALVGCSWQPPAANLLTVTAVSPERVDVGDRVRVVGDGFPQGKAARLTFHGTLHSPGRPPRETAPIVVPAEAESLRRVTALITEDVRAQFCGAGETAVTTTFRGYVAVAFAPRAAGAPPVAGSIDGVVFEVAAPPATSKVVRRRVLLAKEALLEAGIDLDDGRSGRPIVKGVSGVAAAAGLLPGDEVLALEGFRVASAVDFIPPGDSPLVRLAVRRPGVDAPVEVPLRSSRFRRPAPGDAAWALALLIGAVLVCAVAGGPLTAAAAWFARGERLRSPLYETRTGGERLPSSSVMSAVLRPFARMPILARVVPHLALVSVTALWTCMALGKPVVSSEGDWMLLLMVANTLSLVAALLSGRGSHDVAGGKRLSVREGPIAALHAVAHQLPQLLSFAAVVLLAGSLRLADLVSQQGLLPSEWFAFRTPGTWLAFGALVASLVPRIGRRVLPVARISGAAQGVGGPRQGATNALSELLGALHLWLVCGLVAAAFLGGWAMGSTELLEPSFSGRIVAVALFQAKAWGLVVGVVVVRWALQDVEQRDTLAITGKALLPLATLALGLALAWERHGQRELLLHAQGAVSWVLLSMSLVAVVWILRQLTLARRSQIPHGQVNPWL